MPFPVPRGFRSAGSIVKTSVEEFLGDNCPQMAAAVSFYAIFSLPPLIVLIILLVEPFLEPETIVRTLEQELGAFIGPGAAAQIQTFVENVARPGQGGALAALLGSAAFLFGATAAFTQLQAALNTAWGVGPDPRRGDVVNFLIKRILSFLMIVAMGVLLVASLLLSAILGAFGETLDALMPELPSAAILRVIDAAVSFTVATLIFSAMYRFLPDARVRWGAAAIGGVTTALFFTAGTAGVGYWLGQTGAGSAFGAAGSLAILLIWIYYSAMIFLFGAEFTQVWMRSRGEPIRPAEGAVRVTRTHERYEADPDGSQAPVR
jgi:membrane protein